MVLEGAAGMGKTSVLGRLRVGAPRLGLRVVAVTAHELEQQHAFGVARQLLAAVWRSTTDAEHAALVEGVASLALPLVPGARAGEHVAAERQGLLYGTYWLLANLADRSPLLIVVDDAQWADPPSRELLEYLGRRIADLAVLLVLARRPAPLSDADALAPGGQLLVLEPLSAEGVEQVVQRILPGAPPEVAIACHEATGGVPLYVHAVLGEIRARDLPVEGRSVDLVAGAGPEPVVRSVARRLAALGPEGTAVAEALAILGDGAGLARVADLAGLDVAPAGRAVDGLVETGVLAPGADLAFAHPVVRSAVLERLGPQERTLRHARAAALELRAGADVERVAEQVLRAPVGVVEGAADVLRAAAAVAADRGAPAVAATFLTRAAQEPLDPAHEFATLLALGEAQAKLSSPDAPQTLEAAAHVAADAAQRTAVAFARAMVLWRIGRGPEAAAALRGQLNDPDIAPETAQWLRARLLTLTDLDTPSREVLAAELPNIIGGLGPPDGEYGAILLAHRAVEQTLRYVDAAAAGDLAAQALGACLAAMASAQGEEPVQRELLALLTAILDVAERFDIVGQLCSGALAMTAQAGDGAGYALVGVTYIYSRLRHGALREAEAVSRTVLDQRDQLPPWMAAWATAAVRVLYLELERDPDEGDAPQEWDPLVVARETAPGSPEWVRLLVLRGQLRAAAGELEEGVVDLVEAGSALARLGFPAASYHWQTHAAMVLAQLGRHDEAREHAREELRLNEGWGAPRAHGVSRRTVALLAETEEDRITGLGESVAMLEAAQAPLELARTLVELGAALRRANRRADARGPLRRAIALADACGDETRVASRARVELAACGGRAPKSDRTGVAALTPSERRIADLVATGQSNPQVAQQLFISRRTVETHLASAYAKLGISGRSELAAALAEPQASG